MTIQCQRCDTTMHTLFYEGVSIQMCFSCKGVFLDEEKLTTIKETREVKIPKDAPNPRNGIEAMRHCPQCQILMKKRKHGKIRTTVIDYCEECSGIWLDKGELVSIQLSFETAQNNRMRNQFRRI